MSTRVEFETPESGSLPPEGTTPPADPNRPAWLPPQFKSPEDFAKNWQDQRAEITRLQQRAKSPTGGDEPPAEEGSEKPADQKKPDEKPQEQKKPEDQQKREDDAAQEAAKAAGVDLAPYQDEFLESGDVSEESRAKIAEGLTKVLGPNARQIVDEYIEARKVVIENDTKMFFDQVGGKDSYNEMVQWAAKSLPKPEIEAYNAQVNSGDRHAAMFAIEALKAKYEKANGREPSLIKGGSGSPSGYTGFRSTAEMRTAMKDPRYKTDAAYRDEVRERLARSTFE